MSRKTKAAKIKLGPRKINAAMKNSISSGNRITVGDTVYVGKLNGYTQYNGHLIELKGVPFVNLTKLGLA